MAGAKVIDDDGPISSDRERFDCMAPDIASTSAHEYRFQFVLSLSIRELASRAITEKRNL
jgi:hypothetical protein